ncbi:MAG: LysR family transcriptional regulator [Phycisphaerae bacterium]|nr:LysR family transcriptional regulator [Phycisphaerae bacterium]
MPLGKSLQHNIHCNPSHKKGTESEVPTMSKNLKPRLKLWLHSESSQDSFGDGKWRLLEAIDQTESLKAACEKLGISYRKAWDDLKNAEKCLNFTLATRSRGGRQHGQSHLTEKGKAWIKAYAQYRKHMENANRSAYGKYLKNFD